MLDFLMILEKPKPGGSGIVEIYPAFIVRKSKDLMIKGQDFYAVWLEEQDRWSTDEQDALDLIDQALDAYADKKKQERPGEIFSVSHIRMAKNRLISDWHKYVKQDMRDHFHPLNETLVFSNSQTKKSDYSSRRLPYPLQEGSTEAWDKLLGTLYSEEEKHKLEWAVGSIVNGDSKKIQKFMVLYGDKGTGKGTFLEIVGKLFEGYTATFHAAALGNSNNAFPLEDFRDNPLVAIDAEGKLDKIDDNTRLNTIVSHEKQSVNVKHLNSYQAAFHSFLFIASNNPVRITEAKSGLLRRLIDVSPTGNKVPQEEYDILMKQIGFELGAIAWKCKAVYEADPRYYRDYIPETMMNATNDFYNFILEKSVVYEEDDCVTLKAAWEAYLEYVEYAKIPYPLKNIVFKEELKNYFRNFEERHTSETGMRVRNYYSGFLADKFKSKVPEKKEKKKPALPVPAWLNFKEQESLFDREMKDCSAQYAEILEDGDDKPGWGWDGNKVVLSMLDTHRLHYLLVPLNLITVDFDIPGEDGKKNFQKNLEAVIKSGLPPTYAELSKSGQGIHLEYWYDGNPEELSSVYGDHIEVKVRKLNKDGQPNYSSLRRMLTKCNDIPIAHISSGLPIKEVKKTLDNQIVETEKGLRTSIIKALKKEASEDLISTKQNIDFIDHILTKAYDSGLKYDVSDLFPAVLSFAAKASNQSSYCIKLVNRMKFQSDDAALEEMEHPMEPAGAEKGPVAEWEQVRHEHFDQPNVFFDVEVFINLFLVCWKEEGEGKEIHVMINPTSMEIEELITKPLIGFNNRKYDNHILWARLMGYTNEQLFRLSKAIISDKQRNNLFQEAYKVSKTDIYDFSAKKQSLKKFEIDLGIHHQELGFDWDKPVPEDKWDLVAEYCKNDVIATEAVWNKRHSDYVAREILADVADMTVNDTTNQLTTRIIFGKNRKPQSEFNYRDLAQPVRPEQVAG